MPPGLSTADAAARLSQLGPNALPERAKDPLWRRFVRQFQSPLIYILIFALVFDASLWAYEGAHGWPIEALAIAVILLLNAALGLYQERRSEAALAHLKALAAAQAWVMRDGRLVRVPSAELVPGDYVRLEAGDRIPADGTLAEAANPNGSARAIAGVFNETKTVLGLMPHPENAIEAMLGSEDGRGLFKGIAEALA